MSPPTTTTVADEPIDGRYDVIVVGTRVAGASTALLLARAGLRVLAVDRRGPHDDTLSTHALMRAGVVQLARWGLLPALRSVPTPRIDRTTFHYADRPGDPVAVDIRPDGLADGLYAPRRTVLDPLLAGAAATAGAQVRHGVDLVDLRRDHRGRVVGVILRRGGRRFEVAADLVIGADGRRSLTARLVRARRYRTGTAASASVYAHVRGVDAGGYQWCFGRDVAAGAIPTDAELTCVFVSIPAGRFAAEIRPDVRGAFARLLRSGAPGLAEQVAAGALTGRLRAFPGETGFFRRSTGPGWALVGDAGHFDDPATAHGITGALRDAELLATGVLGGTLGGYERARDELALDIFAATDAVASFPEDLDALRGHHLALSQAMRHEAQVVASWPGPGEAAA